MKLLANLGGEEPRGDASGSGKLPPPAVRAGALWSLLFPKTAELLEIGTPDWPEIFGETSDAAFPFLEEAEAWAWLNTGGAAERLAPCTPGGCAPEVVLRVHDKGFAHEVAVREGYGPAWLLESSLLLDAAPEDYSGFRERLRDLASQLPSWQGGWLRLKPRHGSTGRGQLVFRPEEIETEKLAEGVRRCGGPFLIEAELARCADYSVQLFVEADGNLRLLGSLEQRIDGRGLFRGHVGELDSRGRVRTASGFEEELREAAVAVAARAAELGYRGPCGIDAFAYREARDGPEKLRPVVEFNARFTMGIVSLGILRRVLRGQKARLAISPGELRRFVLQYNGGDVPATPEWPAYTATVDPGLWLAIELERPS